MIFKIFTSLLIPFVAFSSNCSHASGKYLEWNIITQKDTFYPGEPILLLIQIKNIGTKDEIINFGRDGIEAFSVRIMDADGSVIRKGSRVIREGLSRQGSLSVPAGQMAQKGIVVNQWCSTLLPTGGYYVICDVDYRLRSESRKQKDSEIFTAGPIHNLQLHTEIQLLEIDREKFEKILRTLFDFEHKHERQTQSEWITQREIAREMITFSESAMAVPYQLKILRVEQYTWRKRDLINSLVKSETVEATWGLIKIFEDSKVRKADIEDALIEAVYQLREAKNVEILNASNDFVSKYSRPVISR